MKCSWPIVPLSRATEPIALAQASHIQSQTGTIMSQSSHGNYLMVLPVAAQPLTGTTFAAESAFCEELRVVRKMLGDHFREFVLVLPVMGLDEYDKRKAYLSEMTEEDGWRMVPAHPAGVSKSRYWLFHASSVFRSLWHEIQQASVVHSGPSIDLRMPFEFPALMLGHAAGKKTISVTDIDHRQTPRMAYESGQWRLPEYLANQYVHGPIRALQHEVIARKCSLVLFKGKALCDDYGSNRPHVKNIFDPAFPPELVVPDERLEAKLRRLEDPDTPLEVLYFGRYVAYKGVDRAILAFAQAHAEEPRRLRLTLMGLGDQEQALRGLVSKLGLDQVVTFKKPIQYGPEFFNILYDYHLLLATPLGEDTPRSIWDAHAAGVPLLAFETTYYSSVASLSHAIDLVTWPSVDEMARRLVHHTREREWIVAASKRAVAAARTNTQAEWLARRMRWISELVHV